MCQILARTAHSILSVRYNHSKSNLNGMPGPTSRHYFPNACVFTMSDWGNPRRAAAVVLVLAGAIMCRNWDWVAQSPAQGLAYHLPPICAGRRQPVVSRRQLLDVGLQSTTWRSSYTSSSWRR